MFEKSYSLFTCPKEYMCGSEEGRFKAYFNQWVLLPDTSWSDPHSVCSLDHYCESKCSKDYKESIHTWEIKFSDENCAADRLYKTDATVTFSFTLHLLLEFCILYHFFALELLVAWMNEWKMLVALPKFTLLGIFGSQLAVRPSFLNVVSQKHSCKSSTQKR